MRKNVRLFLLGVALAGLVGVSVAAADEIVIGVAGPMTGDQAKIGGDIERGARLAVDEWNAKGGIAGKKIRMTVGDDQHDPKQAVSVAHKMVNAGIVGMVGHFNSSASIPASSVYNDAEIPMITPGSTNPQLTEQGFWNVFRVCGRDDQQGNVAADFILRKLQAKRVAILHDRTTYGKGLADEVKRYLGTGAEVVFYDGLTQGDKDFRSLLTAVKAKKPDVYFFGGIYPEGGVLARQAKEVGLSAPLVGGDGMFDPELVKIGGAAAEGSYLTFTPDPEKLPSAKGFLKRYKAKHGAELAPFALYAYDAANILLTAISQAKVRDGKTIADTIRKMKYDGASGHLEFDAKGDIKAAPYVVWRTKGGKFEEFWSPK